MDDAPMKVKEFIRVNNANNADDIDSLVAKLSAEEKAQLVQKLLGQSGLMVVMGGSNVTTSELVIQIHSTSNLDLSELLRAVATRITTQPNDNSGNGKPNNTGTKNQEN